MSKIKKTSGNIGQYAINLTEKENFDWQSFRAEAAKDILCATLSGGTASGMIGIIPEKETIVKASIEIADELIKQLKEKEEQ